MDDDLFDLLHVTALFAAVIFVICFAIYMIFVEQPKKDAKRLACENANGVYVTGRGLKPLCVKKEALIK